MLLKLFLKWMLYWHGIRFYQTPNTPSGVEFLKTVFKTVNGLKISFLFYKETCEDQVFQRGKFHIATFQGYFVKAEFDEGLPDSLKGFNNFKIFLRSRLLRKLSDKTISEILLNMYLEFIKQELQK